MKLQHLLKKDGENSTLKLNSEKIGIGANIFEPISNNKNLVFSFETSLQNISQNHDIDKFSFLTGMHFDEIETSKNLSTELLFLAGASFNKSTRNILTNTTTTGELDVTDDYLSYEVFNWKKDKL